MISKRFSNRRFYFSIFAMVSFLTGVATSSAMAKGGSCARTSDAALKACQYEIKDDLWIAHGNCYNSGSDELRNCSADTKEEYKEAKKECSAQYRERQKICESLGKAAYNPKIKPSNFVDPSKIGGAVTPNPYFPLTPGRTSIYKGGGEIITVTVTTKMKKILGVTCVVVRDVVKEDGEIVEDTDDWFAQDIKGNVWYFGEIAQNFEDGELVDIEGSWTAGVGGALAGIVMEASPQVGDVYRQEFALGDAEDMGEVLNLSGSATTSAASCNGNCLVTKDFTPLEPDVEENKYYAPNIGLILELNPETGDRVELVKTSTE